MLKVFREHRENLLTCSDLTKRKVRLMGVGGTRVKYKTVEILNLACFFFLPVVNVKMFATIIWKYDELLLNYRVSSQDTNEVESS